MSTLPGDLRYVQSAAVELFKRPPIIPDLDEGTFCRTPMLSRKKDGFLSSCNFPLNHNPSKESPATPNLELTGYIQLHGQRMAGLFGCCDWWRTSCPMWRQCVPDISRAWSLR